MTELYQRHCVWQRTLPPPSLELSSLPPLKLLLLLLDDLGDVFSENPTVFHGLQRLCLLFPSSVVVCEDFLERYGELMAAISRSCALSVLGTTVNQEVGELWVSWDKDSPCVQKRNVSAKDFETLSGVCVEFSLPAGPPSLFWRAALARINYRCHTAALSRRWEASAKENGVFQDTCGSLFCYLSTQWEVSPSDFLTSLSLPQKQQLWQAFLSEKACPVEFDWLLDAYTRGDPLPLLEWELSLRSALVRLGITVVNQTREFTILDPSGQPIHFDFFHHCAAEKIFLKLLFPAKISP